MHAMRVRCVRMFLIRNPATRLLDVALLVQCALTASDTFEQQVLPMHARVTKGLSPLDNGIVS